MQQATQHFTPSPTSRAPDCSPPIPAFTRVVPFGIHQRMECGIFQVAEGIPTAEAMYQHYILGLWARGLADEHALAMETGEGVSENSLCAMRFITAALSALAEAIHDGRSGNETLMPTSRHAAVQTAPKDQDWKAGVEGAGHNALQAVCRVEDMLHDLAVTLGSAKGSSMLHGARLVLAEAKQHSHRVLDLLEVQEVAA